MPSRVPEDRSWTAALLITLTAAGLIFSGAAHAAPARKKPGRLVPLDSLPRPKSVEISIPYPNAGMYLYRGIYGSFAGGRSRDYSEPDSVSGSLFQWQGEVGYFYTPWFSGGLGFRINAGSPGEDRQTVENRYFLMTRFHAAKPRLAAYVGARIGVDDVNFSLRNEDTLGLEEPLRETNAGLGLELGAGWKFLPQVGATFGQRMDFSLVPQSVNSPRRALNFMSQPGLALDIVRMKPDLGEHVKAFYLLTELQFGQSLSEQGNWTRQFAWIVGLSLAF